MKLFAPPRLSGKYIDGVLNSGWLTTGPTCQRLRVAVGEFLKVDPKRVVLAASATAGFQAVLDMLVHRSGYIDPPLTVGLTAATWPGMHQAVAHAGAQVAMEPDDRVDVVVLTDIGGSAVAPGDPDSNYLDDHVQIIHDACHSWNPWRDIDFNLVSFYPTKLVPGAEGGAVVCKNPDDAEALADWLYCGLRPGAAGNGAAPRVPGRKANMSDVTAALNLEALELAPKYIKDIAESWALCRDFLQYRNLKVRDQPVRPYLLQIEVEDVPTVRNKLKAAGFESAWNFRPAPLVTLPLWPGMTTQDAAALATAAWEATR
jgi:dTDP-4-amino-4,6-dideoxygalactose transaminase